MAILYGAMFCIVKVAHISHNKISHKTLTFYGLPHWLPELDYKFATLLASFRLANRASFLSHSWSISISPLLQFVFLQTFYLSGLELPKGTSTCGASQQVCSRKTTWKSKQRKHPIGCFLCLAPRVGLEPTTTRLTAAGSTD